MNTMVRNLQLRPAEKSDPGSMKKAIDKALSESPALCKKAKDTLDHYLKDVQQRDRPVVRAECMTTVANHIAKHEVDGLTTQLDSWHRLHTYYQYVLQRAEHIAPHLQAYHDSLSMHQGRSFDDRLLWVFQPQPRGLNLAISDLHNLMGYLEHYNGLLKCLQEQSNIPHDATHAKLAKCLLEGCALCTTLSTFYTEFAGQPTPELSARGSLDALSEQLRSRLSIRITQVNEFHVELKGCVNRALMDILLHYRDQHNHAALATQFITSHADHDHQKHRQETVSKNVDRLRQGLGLFPETRTLDVINPYGAVVAGLPRAARAHTG